MPRIAPFFGLILVLSIAEGRSAAAQDDIGGVRNVTVYAYGTPEGGNRDALFARARVFARHRIETVRTGGLHLDFIDGTELRLGSSSDIVLDEFVFDTNTESGELVANIGKGAFRFVTGKLSGPGFKVITPTAVIGVRGTDFVVLVAGDGSTQVGVLEGAVEMAALDGAADAIVIPAGNSAEVGAGATAVTTGTVIQVTDRALGVSGAIGEAGPVRPQQRGDADAGDGAGDTAAAPDTDASGPETVTGAFNADGDTGTFTATVGAGGAEGTFQGTGGEGTFSVNTEAGTVTVTEGGATYTIDIDSVDVEVDAGGGFDGVD